MSDEILASLLEVLQARPDDVPLRRHVAELLLDGGRAAEAVQHLGLVLAATPGDEAGMRLLARATGTLTGTLPAADPGPVEREQAPGRDNFDWASAETQLGGVEHPFAQPAFVASDGDGASDDERPLYEIERPELRLVDVGGMTGTKQRLESAFLAPLRNPELRQVFGKSLRGGLLLYGPPGCGKTFIARALAGELGAKFTSVSLADVLDVWIGASERNVQELFAVARRAAPCVVFLDEIDALGHKRSALRGSAQRGSVNQLLTELDGVGADNDGVFVLAATNAPWDVDPALRRPGRFDRTLLVLPPDHAARVEILRLHLNRRPVAGIDLDQVARRTEHYSGADLAHVVESATERALQASMQSGEIRPITMKDVLTACSEVRSSTGPWLETARNVAEFGNQSGEYDELVDYLKRRRML